MYIKTSFLQSCEKVIQRVFIYVTQRTPLDQLDSSILLYVTYYPFGLPSEWQMAEEEKEELEVGVMGTRPS